MNSSIMSYNYVPFIPEEAFTITLLFLVDPLYSKALKKDLKEVYNKE